MTRTATFHLHEPWLDADHLCIRVTKVKKDGTPDARCHSDTYTFPVKFVLEAPTLEAVLLAISDGGQLCTYRRYQWLLGSAMSDQLHIMGSWKCVAEIYPVARDYVIDHAHERDGFLDRCRREREEGNAWQELTPCTPTTP